MSNEPETSPADAEMWREILTEGHRTMAIVRWAFRAMPADPRCKLCLSPFKGMGGWMLRHAGFSASRKNPNMCARCLENLPPGGAQVDIAVLFADVRGSTAMGERLDPQEYAAVMNRFYRTATSVLLDHDAIIDKLIGDEVMALFLPGIAGKNYRDRAVAAGSKLLSELGWGKGEPWLDVGVAVHGGPAFVGNVGNNEVKDFTALGDTVNTSARLQGVAAPGELVISEAIWSEILERPERAEQRSLALRGKGEPFMVRVVTPGVPAAV